MGSFHRNLNRMALFTALVLCLVILFYRTFFAIAIANIYLNGVIIGTTLFGIIVCFIKMFQLVPEYRWLRAYSTRSRILKMPPRLLNSVAIMLRTRPQKLTESGARTVLDMVSIRLENERETVRYITNTLVFLGLLGTFWGLILTIGGFADLIKNLNFNDETVLETMQLGLSRPLGGMATAFTSSLLGLGGSLVVGFLGLQFGMAQDAIFNSLQSVIAKHTNVSHPEIGMWPRVESVLTKIQNTMQSIDDKIIPDEQ